MRVLGVQASTAMRAFVKGREAVQAVDHRRWRRDSFVSRGLWHPSIVERAGAARRDAGSATSRTALGSRLLERITLRRAVVRNGSASDRALDNGRHLR